MSKPETTAPADWADCPKCGAMRFYPSGRCMQGCDGFVRQSPAKSETTRLIWRAQCGVDGSRWTAEMKDDRDPATMSFCPDCQARGMTAPGVLNWKADAKQAGELEYQSW